jgi:hypothetical protein
VYGGDGYLDEVCYVLETVRPLRLRQSNLSLTGLTCSGYEDE